MAVRPQAVAFDIFETVMDLEPLRKRFEEIGQPGALLRPWFLRTQRDCMALALSGDFGDFYPAARQALRTDSGHTVTDEQADHVLEGFAALPAHGDAEPALRELSAAGLPVCGLTVGNPDTAREFMERTGLSRYAEHVVTARDAGIWKPAPAVYHTAARRFGVPAERMALVAVHAWDCHGAKRAGCVTGWAPRLEGEYGDIFTPPDVTGRDLTDVARGLLALPAAE